MSDNSSDQSYPPPGAAPPPGTPSPWGSQAPPPPGYSPPGAMPPPPGGGWAPAPGMLGAAHKPGAMPLRPLALGDIYDAAFRIIRFNPRATIGSAVLVASIAMLIPVVVTAALTWSAGLTLDDGQGDLDLTNFLAAYGSVGIGALLQTVGLILVTGMIAHVAAAAAIGRRLSLGEAWAATAGKRWRLIGLAALLSLGLLIGIGIYVVAWFAIASTAGTSVIVAWGIISVPAFIALLWFYWIRLVYLPVPALMLEDVGVLGAIGRGYRLTRGQFWRTFGIALLTVVLTQVAGGVLSLPFTIGGQIGTLAVDADLALLVLIVSQALGTVVSTAFTTPFASAVASLQYLDQRMRKEAYDVELMTQAGVLR